MLILQIKLPPMQKMYWIESKNYIELLPAHIVNELDETNATARTAANFASHVVEDVAEIPSIDLNNSIEGEQKDWISYEKKSAGAGKDNSQFITNMTMLAVLDQNLRNSCLDIQTKRKANIIAQ